MSLFGNPENALRLVLRVNAGASLLIGAVMAAIPGRLADLALSGPAAPAGLAAADWIRLVGLALFPFAAAVLWVSGRPADRPALVRTISAMDWSWVLGGGALLIFGWGVFTWTGAILVDLMATAVAGFAVLQARFLGAAPGSAKPAA